MICNPTLEPRILILLREKRVKQLNEAQTCQEEGLTVRPVNRQKKGGTVTGAAPNSTVINGGDMQVY